MGNSCKEENYFLKKGTSLTIEDDSMGDSLFDGGVENRRSPVINTDAPGFKHQRTQG